MLETERLHLKLIEPNDAKFLFRLVNTEGFHQFIGDRQITDEESAVRYMQQRMSPVLSEKGFINYVMLTKQDNIAVGTCSLHDRKGIDGLDVGYALLPEFEGNGYAYEGAKQMVQMAFEDYHQQQVSAITIEENIGSCRVLERLGFQHQSFLKLPDDEEELKLYVLKKEDFTNFE